MRPSFAARSIFFALAVALACSHAVAARAHKPRAAGRSGVVAGPDARRPSVAADPRGRLYAAFEVYPPGASPDIFCARSSNGGSTWSAAANVSKSPGVSTDPAVAVAPGSGAVYVVWCDTVGKSKNADIYFSRSTNGGKSWSAPANLSRTPGDSRQPALAAGPGGAIHVVWYDRGMGGKNPDVWITSSTNGGKSWSRARNVSRTPGRSVEPAVAVGLNGSVNVAWSETPAGEKNPDIYYSRSNDGGKTWSKATNVSRTPGVSSDADIAADNRGSVYVTWADTSGHGLPDIFLAVSRDGGRTFGKPTNLSQSPGWSGNPSIAADGHGRVAVIWADTTPGTKSPDIWIRVSSDEGKSFHPAANLSRTPGISKMPDVTLAGKRAVGVWEESSGRHSQVMARSLQVK